MFMYLIIVIASIIIQSYIIANKKYLENKKIYYYILNIIILIMCFYIITYNLNKKIILIILVLNILSLIEIFNQKRNNINMNIIKKAIDKSNCGLLALNNQSKVVFQNKKMYDLLKDAGIEDKYIENIKNKSIKIIGSDHLLLIKNKAYLFCISNDEKEITVFDVDKEYKLNEKLIKQNNLLNKNNKDILYVIDNIEKLEKEEKILLLKNHFHDTLGQNLSIIQAYLNQDNCSEKQFKEATFMIKKMFTQTEDESNPKGNLDNLIKAYKIIGVNIIIEGSFPNSIEIGKVYFEIIREAVTNAIKHANSDIIKIKMSNKDLIITNNGIKPKRYIKENIGIKGMRSKVNKINGKIHIYTIPEFMIKITI